MSGRAVLNILNAIIPVTHPDIIRQICRNWDTRLKERCRDVQSADCRYAAQPRNPNFHVDGVLSLSRCEPCSSEYQRTLAVVSE